MRKTAFSIALISLVLLIPVVVQAGGVRDVGVKAPTPGILGPPAGIPGETMFWLDSPRDGAVVSGIVSVTGWILDDRGVSNIDLYVDGVFFGSADLNIPRYDIIQAYPWILQENHAHPGFSTSFDAGALTNGSHALLVRVTFGDGSQEDFGARSVTVDKGINQPPFGELELPGPAQPMDSVFPVTGWALDDGMVTSVEILIDGEVAGNAELGMPRPDVHNRYPDAPNSATAGFVRMFNTSTLTNGVHTLAVRIWDDQGASRVIGRRFVQVFNNGRNLAPFGRIEWPISDHYMYITGCTNPGGWSGSDLNDYSEWELISGWALDVGSRTDDGGVAWLQLLVDGVVQKQIPQDYMYFPLFRMDVNAYGLERPDIHRLFPDVPNSKDAGYTFAINIKELLFAKKYPQGLHYLSVRAGDREGYVSTLMTIPVIFDCDDDPDRPSFGDIYTPTVLERTSGIYEVTGWANDYDFLTAVHIMVDGVVVGDADFYLPSPEVTDRYPWIPASLTWNSGFRYLLDTTKLPDGPHVLVVRTEDAWASQTYVGQRTFIVDNLNH